MADTGPDWSTVPVPTQPVVVTVVAAMKRNRPTRRRGEGRSTSEQSCRKVYILESHGGRRTTSASLRLQANLPGPVSSNALYRLSHICQRDLNPNALPRDIDSPYRLGISPARDQEKSSSLGFSAESTKRIIAEPQHTREKNTKPLTKKVPPEPMLGNPDHRQ